jgi:beta-phosphoglucomutase-like phosphatase (HAD superfamily)
MKTNKAFLFDLNGTMIDDMSFHLKGWYDILNNELGAQLSLEEVRAQMYGKNQELLIRVFGSGHFTAEQMDRISLEKEKRYQAAYLPHMTLIKGLEAFLEKAFDLEIPMAIGSAAIMFNINFVLDNLQIRKYFQSVISADDVTKSKPDPETYLKAAAALQVAPESCIVFEDAPKGVESAFHAGMQSIVLTTLHTREEFNAYSNILTFAEDYTDEFFISLLS